MDDESMAHLHGHAITGGVAGPHQGRMVFTLQTLAACDPDDPFADTVGKISGFSLHAGVAAKLRKRDKLERLCRHIRRPAVSEQRLSLTPNGNVRYQLKTPYRDGTTHVFFDAGDDFDGAAAFTVGLYVDVEYASSPKADVGALIL